jgi:hypothetical protein
MIKPVVKIVADVPPEIKEKAEKIALQRGLSVKQLLVQLIQDIPEEGQPKKSSKGRENGRKW